MKVVIHRGEIAPAAGAVESGAYPAVARSLTARYDGNPCIDRGSNVICMNSWDSQSAHVYDSKGVFGPLDARSNSGQTREAVFCMATQQGGAEIREDDKAPTLTAAAGMSGNNQPTVYCLQGNGIDRADTAGCNGKGWREDVSYTLNTVDRPAVCAGFKLDNSEKSRSIGYEEEMCPTLNAESGSNKPAVLQARMGAGEKQVPLTYAYQSSAELCESGVASTQSARQYKSSTDLVCGAPQCNAVRRLTPLECTRLQGFPDGWVDIGEWTDEKGRVHKEADAPKYKALGNSIALPFWRWMFSRMAQYLPVGATLGSLFDGIGGFPLCWEELHGNGSARWASEVEQFCIAVTKLHFKEETE